MQFENNYESIFTTLEILAFSCLFEPKNILLQIIEQSAPSHHPVHAFTSQTNCILSQHAPIWLDLNTLWYLVPKGSTIGQTYSWPIQKLVPPESPLHECQRTVCNWDWWKNSQERFDLLCSLFNTEKYKLLWCVSLCWICWGPSVSSSHLQKSSEP